MADTAADEEEKILLDGNNLRLEDVISVARKFTRVELSAEAKERMKRSRDLVEQWVGEGAIIYGVTTGFGSNQDKNIPAEEAEFFQRNLIISHSAGVGPMLNEEAVRAMMLLRANALAKGCSGIRVEVVERLLGMINKRICPIVPIKGSVGSSGDLAPLSHMTLALIGRGEVFFDNQRMPASEALSRAGIEPVRLNTKEGLALTNGTQFMTGIGSLALCDAEILIKVADIAGAMTIESMKGKSAAFAEEIHLLRPFPGQIASAQNIRALIEGSELIDLIDEHTEKKRQDAYSLRCLPQVHGASRQAMTFARQMLEVEINSATDNPLILPDYVQSYSAGNFHGQPVALTMDFLALALSEIGNISERRIARLVNVRESFGLPGYLIDNSGFYSGVMMAQYTAAALASENKVLIHPASGDSIPTSANQEDHNSMGSIAARQAREILENVQQIIGLELVCAAQALGLREREGHQAGAGTRAAYNFIRKSISQIDTDREIYVDFQKALAIVQSGEIIDEVNNILAGKGRGPLV
jgi:histidine ammonia-lyase